MAGAGLAMPPVLEVEQLSVRYRSREGETTAVDRVSFALERGEVLALVGESGCGKTSAALALTRLLPEPPAVVTGRVYFGELDVLAASPAQLRAVRGGRIAYVFQEPAGSLNPVLTIGEQLLETIRLHTGESPADARRTAADWLTRVGIPDAARRLGAYPHEFSGGMQQRAMIAMALATRPDVLIADEPTTALDVTVQLQLLRLLRDLQRTLQLSVLLISHDLTVVERIAHRVGVMAQGRLVEFGPMEQVLRRPAHPHTAQLVRDRSLVSLRRSPPDAHG